MTTTNGLSLNKITIGQQWLRIEDVVAIAHKTATAVLNDDDLFKQKIQKGADFLDELLASDGHIYGVTTGYGDSVTRPVPLDLVPLLPKQLATFHGCGMGALFDPVATRAILAVRLCSLGQGYSGVSWGLLTQLLWLLQEDVLPRIPEEGSVGASGDLTPLSYVAAVLMGERQVWYQEQWQPAESVYQQLGQSPLVLRPKEALAIMNGTAVMTALACLAYDRCVKLMHTATRITSLMTVALDGNEFHYSAALFAAKPHLGQQQVAARLRADLNSAEFPVHSQRLQDRYSLRCAPHIIGVVADSLAYWRQLIENELNSANDNPLIDPEQGLLMHGGHFYGGHIAQAMDGMKTAVANLADLLDRQLAQLVDSKTNKQLPPNISGKTGREACLHHGFKAVQIGTSAWAAEALKLTMPASVFSRSTESHNQDKVSMGTIAARDCLRVLTLTEQVAAAALMGAVQGVHLRVGVRLTQLPQALQNTVAQVNEVSPFLVEDRALESELRAIMAKQQVQGWADYEI